MELPRRDKGDEYTTPGRYRELESSVQRLVDKQDIPILFMYAFDYRTRLGPFLFIDKKLIPGAPRAIGSALHAAGFKNTRLVMQQWTPNVRPSSALIAGRTPEVLMISSMQIHSAAACELIRDAFELGEQRPLIIAGGPKAIYEPWDFFEMPPDGRCEADLVVTGEEFVLLELMERLLEHKSSSDTMLDAFQRVRREELLDDIPGLVYRPAEEGHDRHLINTGIQRLVQDLDELPLPFEALGMFEGRHRRKTLAREPVSANRLYRHGRVISMVTTHGCKFRCPYCPIPAYNQFTFRYRSPERLADEFAGIAELSGINFFFGTDDNFFNNRETVEEIFSAMSRGKVNGKPFRDSIFLGTEGTEFDVFKQQDLLPLARDAGLRAIWFGIEDMTAELVKKGQTPEKTEALFKVLLRHGIAPMPMMMHHDGQPLWSWGSLYGILNQVRYLKRAGAVSVQVTFLMPSIGSKGYEQPFQDGMVMSRVGGIPVEDYQYDGNHCIASNDDHPWRKQLNLLLSYLYFYNPSTWLRAAMNFDSLRSFRIMYQTCGNLGAVKSAYQVRDWFFRMVSGPIEKCKEAPRPKITMAVPEHVSLKLAHYDQGTRLHVLQNEM